MNTTCQILPRGFRRDGKPRYWCVTHKADATGKGGVREERCRRAHLPTPTDSETLRLDPNDYKGGIGAWGAVPPIYSTAQHNFEDIGIHIHARHQVNGSKKIDRTYSRVDVLLENDLFERKVVEIDEEAAIYYMVCQVLGYKMRNIECTHCGASHLDKDVFAVRPHKRHLCASCGRYFNDRSEGIGNPLIAVREYVGDFDSGRSTKKPKRQLEIKQSDFANGIELWGSNQAILWTSPSSEEEGIHVHCYDESKTQPVIDETYDSLTIDGTSLDPNMIRVLMAQRTLPHLSGRIRSLECPSCHVPHMDSGSYAHRPHVNHKCQQCGCEYTAPGRIKAVVSNPMLRILDDIANLSPLKRNTFRTNLLPEAY